VIKECGIVEAIQAKLKSIENVKVNALCGTTKRSRLNDMPTLDDANKAGTDLSDHCTLILTEGESAKTVAVAGLGIIGRDNYGIFPLKGKLLNVRGMESSQVNVTFRLLLLNNNCYHN